MNTNYVRDNYSYIDKYKIEKNSLQLDYYYKALKILNF